MSADSKWMPSDSIYEAANLLRIAAATVNEARQILHNMERAINVDFGIGATEVAQAAVDAARLWTAKASEWQALAEDDQ